MKMQGRTEKVDLAAVADDTDRCAHNNSSVNTWMISNVLDEHEHQWLQVLLMIWSTLSKPALHAWASIMLQRTHMSINKLGV